MIREIYSEESKSIIYVHDLVDEDYDMLSENLELNKKKIKDITNEEIFTPRISKSDWDIYKLYYPEIKSEKKEEKFGWCEISPLVILKKDDKIVIIDANHHNEFYDFDDNCIIGWDNGMQTYFFYNGHEDLFIGGIDGKIYKSVFAVLYKLIKLGYSFKFRNENIIDNLLDKMESR